MLGTGGSSLYVCGPRTKSLGVGFRDFLLLTWMTSCVTFRNLGWGLFPDYISSFSSFLTSPHPVFGLFLLCLSSHLTPVSHRCISPSFSLSSTLCLLISFHDGFLVGGAEWAGCVYRFSSNAQGSSSLPLVVFCQLNPKLNA